MTTGKKNTPAEQSLIDLDTEANLLSGIITRPAAIDAVVRIINPADFADDRLSRLFDSVVMLHEARKPVGDIAALHGMLGEMGTHWSAAELGHLMREHFTSAPEHAAETLARLAKLRRTRAELESAAVKCSEVGADPDSIGRDLADTLLAAELHQRSEVESAPNVGKRVLETIDCRDRQRGIMLGVRAIDETIGVVCPGEVIVLAARPGIGKTALAMQIAHENAMMGRGVLFVSLEMDATELVQRTLCSEAGVDQGSLRTGVVSANDRQTLTVAQGELPESFRIWSPHSATIADIRGVARLEARQHDLRLIVIDYLQLIDGNREDRRANRYEQITRISREVKQLAKLIGVPVLTLSQLSRAGNERPQLVHLRESGAIEQDADIVLLLSRDGSKATLDVAKHRHGETGEFPLAWSSNETRFGDSLV